MADLVLFNSTCKVLSDRYGGNRGCEQDVINAIIGHLDEIERLYKTLPVIPESDTKKRRKKKV